jgi:hypothetical protein
VVCPPGVVDSGVVGHNPDDVASEREEEAKRRFSPSPTTLLTVENDAVMRRLREWGMVVGRGKEGGWRARWFLYSAADWHQAESESREGCTTLTPFYSLLLAYAITKRDKE